MTLWLAGRIPRPADGASEFSYAKRCSFHLHPRGHKCNGRSPPPPKTVTHTHAHARTRTRARARTPTRTYPHRRRMLTAICFRFCRSPAVSPGRVVHTRLVHDAAALAYRQLRCVWDTLQAAQRLATVDTEFGRMVKVGEAVALMTTCRTWCSDGVTPVEVRCAVIIRTDEACACVRTRALAVCGLCSAV